MPKLTTTFFDLLDRAAEDPVFLHEWAEDPLEVARAAGCRITFEDLKLMLGIAGATDAELIDVLRGRVSNVESCCGCWFKKKKCAATI